MKKLLLCLALIITGCGGNDRQEKQSAAIRAEGYQCAIEGITADACPYIPMYQNTVEAEKRSNWLKGWIEGKRSMLSK